ncbi:hypothetical protein FFWV33_05860 [Flavobacterium faecale]|uniref:Uncharacterized protein n=1 Tax=Flavobacterium faecale TaxID=1355330 RepID=A0A2S1LBH8_9FLAO|nr:hypothetical protein [Flavobacterium faecale]AWG21091.1 hypothetical protein FFWV33_05860 [Flavobacterium faecale]
MKEIQTIYQNEFGVSFYWKVENQTCHDTVQLVFKETGLQLNANELVEFKCLIEDSISKNKCCDDCSLKSNCTKYLLKTPFHELDLAMSIAEMDLMNNLISTTLFKINLNDYQSGMGRN